MLIVVDKRKIMTTASKKNKTYATIHTANNEVFFRKIYSFNIYFSLFNKTLNITSCSKSSNQYP